MVILIVDGNLHRQRQLRTVLGSLGYRTAAVECVPDFKSGLTTLRQRRFDCCFVAMSGPKEQTRSFLDEVRSTMVLRSLYIIVFGPAATKEEVVCAIEAGANLFLTYPFTPEHVESALARASTR
jgi:CheY-like chemotaxis protein